MLKRFKNVTLKLLVNTVGQTSNGLRLCTNHGFTSGKMLDYIYLNEPSGKYIIGKLIDRIFIRHAGWEAIRTRKTNLVNLLNKAIDLTLREKEEVNILDVAAGPARYILDSLTGFDNRVSAVCRDIDERWLEEGQKNAFISGLTNIKFEKGDALDTESFKSLNIKQDIIVSSGFYDWIVDDELVKKSMQIIYENLKPGGYFVFTNQSGHIDLNMAQEVFSDFNGEPLRMTTRKAQLMNDWTKELGFTIIETRQDKAGYYSVTLARK